MSKITIALKAKCAVPENIHTPPTEGIGISWGVGGSVRPKNLKKCMKFIWNFQRGGGVLEKIPSMGEVWIFSGITQSFFLISIVCFTFFNLVSSNIVIRCFSGTVGF